jgi:amidase
MTILRKPPTLADLAAQHQAGQTRTDLIAETHAIIAADDNRAIIESNPDAALLASLSDARWQAGTARSLLDGIPIAIKDNIDTGDRMHTTAGSAALLSSRPRGDAFLMTKLRAAGMIPIAKANMSEWANFRANRSSSGYSTRGGQCTNPHDATRCPSGSSSGSAAAVAAGLVAVALGSETDGSIISPSARCGVVGIKPSVGLVSRGGVIPISPSQDTVGTHANTVADAAAVLAIIAGSDPHDSATTHIPTELLHALANPINPSIWRSLRIGVARKHYSGFHPLVDQHFSTLVDSLKHHGLTIIDDVIIEHTDEVRKNDAEFTVLLYEFKQAINAYLKTRIPFEGMQDIAPRSLTDVIAYNRAHPNPGFFFDQELFELAEAMTAADKRRYQKARRWCQEHAGTKGIDAALQRHQLDAIIVPSGAPAWPIDQINGDHYRGAGDSTTMAACAGYPLITVPMSSILHLPIGVTIMGSKWSDATLINVAAAIESIVKG